VAGERSLFAGEPVIGECAVDRAGEYRGSLSASLESGPHHPWPRRRREGAQADDGEIEARDRGGHAGERRNRVVESIGLHVPEKLERDVEIVARDPRDITASRLEPLDLGGEGCSHVVG